MSGNESLSAKQQLFLAGLLSGKSVVAAAKAVKISEPTAHRWLKDEGFKRALDDAKQAQFTAALSALQDGIDSAIRGVKLLALGHDVPPNVKLRALQIWIEQAVGLHTIKELERKIASIEELVVSER